LAVEVRHRMKEDTRQPRHIVAWRRHYRYRLLSVLLLLVGLVAIIGGLAVRQDEESRNSGIDCPLLPTAALPFDPANEQQLAAYATDIFIGQVVGEATGPEPASPVPGAPTIVPRHFRVTVLKTEKGSAEGTVVVHQGFYVDRHACNIGVSGDYSADFWDVVRFFTVRDASTGTYNLIAGPYSHGSATPQPIPFQTATFGP
jgi:hypothetical protein